MRSLAHAVGSTRLAVVGGAGSLLASPGVRASSICRNSPRPTGPNAQAAGLAVLRGSRDDLDWTYLSPAPEIGPGERTAGYLVGADEPAGDFVSFEDFAVALVDELEQPKHQRVRFTVAQQMA